MSGCFEQGYSTEGFTYTFAELALRIQNGLQTPQPSGDVFFWRFCAFICTVSVMRTGSVRHMGGCCLKGLWSSTGGEGGGGTPHS